MFVYADTLKLSKIQDFFGCPTESDWGMQVGVCGDYVDYLMQSAKESEKFQTPLYDILVIKLQQQKLHIRALKKSNGALFEDKELTLSKLNYQAVVGAFKGERKQLKVEFGEVNIDGLELLEITVSFYHHLLPPVIEVLPCKKQKELGQAQLMKNQLTEFPMRFDKIRKQLQTQKKPLFVAWTDKTIECRDASQAQVISITLNKGTYIIRATYLAKVSNQWIYIHLDKFKTKFIDQQGYYMPPEARDQFCPGSLRGIVEIPSDQFQLRLTVTYGSSYPATLKNVVLTAQRIDDDHK